MVAAPGPRSWLTTSILTIAISNSAWVLASPPDVSKLAGAPAAASAAAKTKQTNHYGLLAMLRLGHSPYRTHWPGDSNDSDRSTPRAVLKMSFGDLDGMLVSENPFHHIPGTGLAGSLNRFNWRENVRQAHKYIRDLAEHEKAVKAGDEDSRPPRKSVSDDLIRLVKKEIPLRTDASSVTQIRDMLKLAHDLDYNLILENPYEGWMIPDELANAKASVIFTPRLHAAGLLPVAMIRPAAPSNSPATSKKRASPSPWSRRRTT